MNNNDIAAIFTMVILFFGIFWLIMIYFIYVQYFYFSIELEGEELLFCNFPNIENGITQFYQKISSRLRKRYWLFGPTVTCYKVKYLFSIEIDIKSCKILKSVARSTALQGYTKYKDFLEYSEQQKRDQKKRCDEIKNGEII